MKDKQIQLLLLFPIALILSVLGGCSGAGNAQAHLEKARAYVENDNYSAAEIELKNALKPDPKNAEALALLGEVYSQQGRMRDAFQVLSVVKQTAPEDGDSLAILAGIELVAGMREKAKADARKALELNPSNKQAPLILSETASDPADRDETAAFLEELPTTAAIKTALGSLNLKFALANQAKTRFDEALELDPNFGPAYAGKYVTHLIDKETDLAEQAIAKAAEVTSPRSGIQIRYVQHLIRSGKKDEARSYLGNLVEQAPDYLPALTLYAGILAESGAVEDAKQLINRALKLDSIDREALRLKGTIAALGQNYDDAIKTLEYVLELYPEDTQAHFQIALAHIASKRDEKALSHLQFVNRKAPAHLEAAVLLANLQLKINDPSGAVITLQKLIENRPNSPEAKLILAEAYNRQGNYDDALALYQQIEAGKPKNPHVDYLTGLTKLRKADQAGARQSFESALANNPLHIQSMEQLTALDVRENDYRSALTRIDSSIAQAPEISTLHVLKGQILHAMNESEAAESAYLKAVELDPDSYIARMQLGRFYHSRHQSDPAINQFRQVIEVRPDDIPALSSIAASYAQNGEKDKELASYQRIIEVDPNSVIALNNLAYEISKRDGPSDRALALAEKARLLSPNNPYTNDTLGWICYLRGDYDRARAILIESHNKLAENPEVNYHLGAVYYMLGFIDDAKKHLEKATLPDAKFDQLGDAQEKLQTLSIDSANASASDKTYLESVLADLPTDPLALAKLGQIALQSGDHNQAIAHFKKALKSTPQNLTAKLSLAAALLEQGKPTEAMEFAKEAARQAPNNAQAIYVQGKTALALNDFEWASSLLAQAARQIPDNGELHLDLAAAQLAIGRLAADIESTSEAIQRGADKEYATSLLQALLYVETPSSQPSLQTLTPDSLPALLAQATMLESSSQSGPAKAKYEAILERFPKQAQAKLGLATILSADPKNAERVYALANDVRKADSSNVRARALQGLAAYQQDDYKQATQFLGSIDTKPLPASLRALVEDAMARMTDD